MTSLEALVESGRLARRRGKVRDIYDLGGDRLLIVASDRISAYDWVLPNAIPDKGRVLTALSLFWFERITICRNHLIASDPAAAGLDLPAAELAALDGRAMIVHRAEVIPFECVVRGYLSGSAWREYRSRGTVCGQALPGGLRESQRIPCLFTPATKAESGHDENVPIERMAEALGEETACRLAELSMGVYDLAAEYALGRGLILADTKFEWGWQRTTGELMLVDEVLTPDSSRYWPKAGYAPGRPQPSFDKQYVRDWLDTTSWDKASPPPPLPDEVVARTREKYVEAYETLTGRPFPWK